ncbi:CaiB/BaiF CoA-transferase family protein [Streptomyces sp. ACA25]|uniref:CaiB/BaiF CoA transferase family protein n=1 Tax=Streptomyces sp. ACA25 TaxID=3022596 RepID=UPI0023077C82|nr:CaiB/BaiF CoA-transferase family protein [Streptomyces sp. ACA25]MDB1089555.1 CaiB/BaiF CoA-transferase family protein [Streptomyces sp. ACA25]
MTTAGENGGPLGGLRVVELAGIGPAPYACMVLADLGAEVIRVDRADGARSFADWHEILDRGRRSVALDLKQPAGAEALLRLTDGADVLVEGFRPGVAERLGIGPADCRDRNPRLVYARMTGWGQDGPLAAEPGHDINYIALTGVLDAIGQQGGPPVPPLNLLGDFAGGGMLLVGGVLAALYERQRSGLGQVVDAAIVDGAASLTGMLLGMTRAGQWTAGRGGNLLDGGAPFYDVYACADGRFVAVGALEDRFYEELLDGLGLCAHELPDRDLPADWPALRQLFAGCFATRTRDEWAEHFRGTGGCVTPVLSVTESAEHPHHRMRGTFLTASVDPGAEAPQPAPAPRFDRTSPGRPAPAPTTGAHTREVLTGICGFTEPEVERLLASGAARPAL